MSAWRRIVAFSSAAAVGVILAAASGITVPALADAASQLNGTWTFDFTVGGSTNPIAKPGQTLTGLTFTIQGTQISGDLNGTVNLTPQTLRISSSLLYLADVTGSPLGAGVSCQGQIYFTVQGSPYVGTAYTDSIKCSGGVTSGTISGHRVNGPTAPLTTSTTARPAGKVTITSATLDRTGHGVFRWTMPDDHTTECIEIARVDGPYVDPASWDDECFELSLTDLSYTSPRVLPPGSYRIKVVALSPDYTPTSSNIVSLEVAAPAGRTTTTAKRRLTTVVVPTPAPEIVGLGSVSNGCGGGEAGTSPRFLDEVTFDSGTKDLRFKVRFRQACNVHDAGYGGVVVRDPLHGNKVVDFRTWTRKQVDDKFHTDLKQLCAEQIPSHGAGAAALKKCQAYADAYWVGVRTFGWTFFDADAQASGDQTSGPRCRGRSSKLC